MAEMWNFGNRFFVKKGEGRVRAGQGFEKRGSLGNCSFPPLSVGLAPVFISMKKELNKQLRLKT